MIASILWLILGLALIMLGANMLTDGSVAVARRMGISDLVTGLTVVAFGTSAPELAISVISAAGGNPGLALGNVVGSNIFNILMITGVTALVRPIAVTRGVLANDMPLTLLAALTLPAMYYLAPAREVSRADGVLLLLFFMIFMRYTFATAKNAPEPSADPSAEDAGSRPKMPLWRAIVWIAAGLCALVWGGDRFVDGASGVARGLGVSEAIIGLTIVAAGTSLPELATSVVAAVKGNSGIAIGNVIGSCIFNIFLVLGVSATVMPLPFGGVTGVDLWVLVGASALLWIAGRAIGVRTITRAEGALFAAAYVAYTLWLILQA